MIRNLFGREFLKRDLVLKNFKNTSSPFRSFQIWRPKIKENWVVPKKTLSSTKGSLAVESLFIP